MMFSRIQKLSVTGLPLVRLARSVIKPPVLPDTKALIRSPYNELFESAKRTKHQVLKQQFASALLEFKRREKFLRGHVNFISLALRRMDEFGLQKDVLTYNRLLDLFPKGRFKPKRLLDVVWPRILPQSELALELLTKMEENGVTPDYNTHELLKEVFGRKSFPVLKCERLAYWFNFYKNIDPYTPEGGYPDDPFELAKLTVQRISKSKAINEIQVPIGDDQGYVIGALTCKPSVMEDLGSFSLLQLDGPHRIWMLKKQMFYYALTAMHPKSPPTADEEKEEEVLAVCVCNPPNTHEKLQSWMEALKGDHQSLANATVVDSTSAFHGENETERKLIDVAE